VVVGFEAEFEAEDLLGGDEGGEDLLDAGVGAEAVDALPRREREGGDEALALERAMGEKVTIAGGEEVGFALEAVAIVDGRGGNASCGEDAFVVGLFAGAGGQQVGEVEAAGGSCELGVDVLHEAGIGGVDEAGLRRIRRDDEDAYAEVLQYVAQAVPLADGEGAVDAALRAPARARVGVGAASDTEMRRIPHEHAPLRARFACSAAHGRGTPGGSVSGSNPSSLSRWAWGKVQ